MKIQKNAAKHSPRYTSRPRVEVVRPGASTIVFKVLTLAKLYKGHPVCAMFVGGLNGGFTRCCRCEDGHNRRDQAIDCTSARERARSVCGDQIDAMLDEYRKTDDKILREDMAWQ